MHKPVSLLFLEILMTCDQLKRVGREMFAIDGRKMSSNARKEWSGTHNIRNCPVNRKSSSR